MRFKVGQEVTPNIKNDQWTNLLSGGEMPFPEFGKVYTVAGYPSEKFPEFLALEEISDQYIYWEGRFEPLVPSARIEEELEQDIVTHG